MPRSVLSKRLAGLVTRSLMERRAYHEAGQRARIEYPLTRMGAGARPAVHGDDRMGRQTAGRRDLAVDVAVAVDGAEALGSLVDERGKRAKRGDIELVVDAGIARKM